MSIDLRHRNERVVGSLCIVLQIQVELLLVAEVSITGLLNSELA